MFWFPLTKRIDWLIAVLFARPKIAELAFRVYEKTLHPELYFACRSRCIQRSLFSASIVITNCGHVITWVTPNSTFCEITTGLYQPLPNRNCLVAQPLKGRRTEFARSQGGATYKSSFHLESVDPEMFWIINQQFSCDSEKGLVCKFESSGRIKLGAISYVNTQTKASSLFVQAVHSFPDDYAILKVESIFSLPG
jgi:hypothetical protein